jgi:hypothetical protein
VRIKSFTGNDTDILDHEIDEFLKQAEKYGETAKVRDIKITATVQPAGMFVDNRGFATETMYTYVVLYD